MGFLNYRKRPRVMVVANGHPYSRSGFMGMFDGFDRYESFLVEQPAAEHLLTPSLVGEVDAIVFYDMPGGDPFEGPGFEVEPSERFKQAFVALLDAGMPVVALHHAIAGWPTWSEYAELLGGRLIHFPGEVRGRWTHDSGYLQDTTYTVRLEENDHPIFEGLPKAFEIEDEAYLFDVFEDAIDPLLRSSLIFDSKTFWSLARAMQGDRRSNAGWQRPNGSNIIGWAKRARNSALVYFQMGHGRTAFANPCYQRLVRNAVDWTIATTPSFKASRAASDIG